MCGKVERSGAIGIAESLDVLNIDTGRKRIGRMKSRGLADLVGVGGGAWSVDTGDDTGDRYGHGHWSRRGRRKRLGIGDRSNKNNGDSHHQSGHWPVTGSLLHRVHF